MKKCIIALFIISGCLSVHAQFFSKEEAASLNDDKVALKTELPEAEQKEVYLQLCKAEAKAGRKSANLYQVKIQHTPEQRIEQQKKANHSKATLLTRYKTDLAKKYLITEDCLAQIEKNGHEKNWPKDLPKPETN
jgi:hypothetical protein